MIHRGRGAGSCVVKCRGEIDCSSCLHFGEFGTLLPVLTSDISESFPGLLWLCLTYYFQRTKFLASGWIAHDKKELGYRKHSSARCTLSQVWGRKLCRVVDTYEHSNMLFCVAFEAWLQHWIQFCFFSLSYCWVLKRETKERREPKILVLLICV